MRESAVESKLRREIQMMGGLFIKLMPTHVGVPDRLVLLPGGAHYLVEVKADDGYLHPAQYVWHQRSEAIGHPVRVVRGSSGVDEFVSELRAVVD